TVLRALYRPDESDVELDLPKDRLQVRFRITSLSLPVWISAHLNSLRVWDTQPTIDRENVSAFVGTPSGLYLLFDDVVLEPHGKSFFGIPEAVSRNRKTIFHGVPTPQVFAQHRARANRPGTTTRDLLLAKKR